MELEADQKVKILLEPLSHGARMTSLLIEALILDVQTAPQCHDDFEADISVAAYRVTSEDEVDDNGISVDDGSWSPMTGAVQTMIKIGDGPWTHTTWPSVVNFV